MANLRTSHYSFEMIYVIESPAACEIHSFVCFMNAKEIHAYEIHNQVCEVYGENAMSKEKLQKWVCENKPG